jgi:hypothetical protein
LTANIRDLSIGLGEPLEVQVTQFSAIVADNRPTKTLLIATLGEDELVGANVAIKRLAC